MALNFGKLNFSTSFNPTSAFPIDARSYFESYEAAVAAAATAEAAGSSNTTYYIGQIFTVNEGGTVAAYQINGNKTLIKLAATTSSGDLAADVAALQGQVGAIISGDQVVGKATADAAGNEIAATYATKAVASADADGLMSSADKSKLDGIAAGAQVNVIEGVTVKATSDGSFTDLQILDKKVQLDLSTYATKADLTAIPKFSIQVVDQLPTESISTTTVYLMAHPHGEGDGYDEYIYVNNTWEKIGNTDVDLSAYATTAAMNEAIATATTDMATNASVNSKLANYATTESMNTALAGKADATAVSGINSRLTTAEGEIDALQGEMANKVEADDVTSAIAGATIQGSQVSGIVPEAAKVSNALTAGKKTYNGSTAVEITAEDLGALTAVPQASDSALGGIMLGHVDSGDGDEYAVELDGEGRAFVTVPVPEMPDVPAYTAGNGISVTPNENDFIVAIATGGVTTDMIANGAVTDAKLSTVNVQKLFVAEGDALVLDGGNATTGQPQA